MLIEFNRTAHTNEDSYVQLLFDNRQQLLMIEDNIDRSNNTLDKNFNNAYMILDILKKVYEMGLKSEQVEFKVNIIE